MIKVAATGDARTQVMQLVDVYRARIVDVSPESLVIETTGTEDKIDSLLEVLRPYGIDRDGPDRPRRDGARQRRRRRSPTVGPAPSAAAGRSERAPMQGSRLR